MFDSKRRPASTQAVSRKVEGIEPRNQVYRKDDGVRMPEVKTSTTERARVCSFLGSETTACVTQRLHGNPGGPAVAFGGTTRRSKRRRFREYAKQPHKGRAAKSAAGSRIV